MVSKRKPSVSDCVLLYVKHAVASKESNEGNGAEAKKRKRVQERPWRAGHREDTRVERTPQQRDTIEEDRRTRASQAAVLLKER